MAAKRGVEVGVGYVSIVPSAKDFARQLKADLNPRQLGTSIGKDINQGIETGMGPDPVGSRLTSSTKGAGSALDSMLGGFKKVAVAGAALGGALAIAGKQAFDAFSDQNEAISKAQTVFGDAFERVDAVAQGAAKSMGLSRTAALDAAATFGNLFRAMGIGTGPAADMSLTLNQLAGDLASFNNVDPEEALQALRSGLLGEAEPLRRFGVNLNEARINAEALRLGLVHNQVVSSDVTEATTKLESAQVAQNEAMKKYGQDSLQYRTATVAVANAQQALDTAMAGHKVELDAGQKAQAAYSLIMKDTSVAQGDYARTAEGAANKQRTLSAEWDNFKAKVGEKLAPLGAAVLGGLETSLTWLSDWWTNNGDKVLDGLGKVKDWFLSTFGPDPVANFVAGADIIKGKFAELFGPDPVEAFKAGATEIGTKWDELFGQFEAGAKLVDEKIGPAWDTLGRAIIEFKEGVLDPYFGTLQTVWGAIWDFWNKMKDLWGGILDLIGKTGEPAGKVLDIIQGLLPKAPELPPAEGHATGGVIGGAVGKPRMVLAHGGETVLPTHRPDLAYLRGITAAQLAAPPAPAGPLVGSMTVSGQADPAGSAWAIRRELRRMAFYAGSAYAG